MTRGRLAWAMVLAATFGLTLGPAQAGESDPRQWPSFGIDPTKPADALEHVLDRTIVVINNTTAKLHFSIKLPSQPDWVEYPSPARDALGIFCPICDEDAQFRFFMQTTKGPINRVLKANYRYMIVAGNNGNWDILTGPALH